MAKTSAGVVVEGGVFVNATNLSVGFGPSAIAIGDINGDGNADLVALNNRYPSSPSYVVMLLGNGAGHFTNAGSYVVGNNPYAVALADFDGDGRLDVVTANNIKPGSLSVLLNRSAPVIAIRRQDVNMVELTWPNWAGYQLECATNTALTNTWISVTNAPDVVGNRKVVTNSVTSGGKFYRLKH